MKTKTYYEKVNTKESMPEKDNHKGVSRKYGYARNECKISGFYF